MCRDQFGTFHLMTGSAQLITWAGQQIIMLTKMCVMAGLTAHLDRRMHIIPGKALALVAVETKLLTCGVKQQGVLGVVDIVA